jgi:ABC-type sugar transport system substrate-binding protein
MRHPILLLAAAPLTGVGCPRDAFAQKDGYQTKDGYQAIAINSAPGMGAAAFWLALDILNGANAPKKSTPPAIRVAAENLSQHADLPPGSIVSPKLHGGLGKREPAES